MESPTALRSAERAFTIRLEAEPAEATPLFGPVRESEWAPDWAPRFVHPGEAGQREGAVFYHAASGTGPRESLWVMTRYGVEEGRVAYVVVTPEFAVTEIGIRVEPGPAPGTSEATVTYRRSALVPEANECVARFEAHHVDQRGEWESAVNAALRRARAR